MKKLFLITTLSISTFIVGCGCGNSEPTNTIVPETETQVTELETETEIATEEIIETEETELVSIEIVETLDTIMYVIKDGSIYTGDGIDYEILDTLVINAEAHVTGKTANGWYEVDCGTVKGYVPADCLSITEPSTSTSNIPKPEDMTEEEFQKILEEIEMYDKIDQEMEENLPQGDIESSGGGNWDNLPDDLSQVVW